jgi:chemotaxis protein MotA
MDFTSIIGIAAAFGLLTWSILLGGDLMLFWDFPSVVMVFGGSIAVTVMATPGSDLRQLVKVVLRAFFLKARSPMQEIERIIEYSNLARKEGLLALEEKLKSVDDPFFAKGIQLVIDGFSAETVQDIMQLEADWQRQRHSTGKKMLDTMATYGPAFGMIGTLVGLVQMLANLSDPSSIGAGMAVALLTTFYGAVAANVVFMPLSTKLDARAKEEALLRELMIAGIIAVQSGEKPALIKEKLKSFLSPQARMRVKA